MSGQAQELKKELSELVQAQAEHAQELRRFLSEQAEIEARRVQEQRDIRDEATSQGRLVTVFTIISGVFLPLGFFSTASIALPKRLFISD